MNNYTTVDILVTLPTNLPLHRLVTSWQTYPATAVTLTTELRGRQPDGVAEIPRTRQYAMGG
jgi:hypothetical protein